ncbi:MAG: carbonic anhydrase [Bacteroidales bacterium]|nr:carbonic anhydrase [Bacteroidales bacterium]
MAYKTVRQIFEHNKEWIAERLKSDPDYFKKLSQRQVPKYLFFGCSDSRISTEAIMASEPGDVFTHRNIANVISGFDLNILSVINYAVNHLRVKRIVVCGHYGCGGVKTAMSSTDEGLLNPWLRNIRDVYRLHMAELNNIGQTEARYDRLVELNVIEQCINLVKTRDVQKALLEKRITIHGWVFDMRTGQLIDLKFNTKKAMKEIMAIYTVF